MSDISFNENYVLLPRELRLLKGNCKYCKTKRDFFFFPIGQQKKNPSSTRSMSQKLIFYYIIRYLYFNCLSTWIFKTAQFFTAKIPNQVWSFSQQRASRHQQLEAFQPRNCFYTASSQWDEHCCSEFQATQVGWEAVSAKLVKSSPGWS